MHRHQHRVLYCFYRSLFHIYLFIYKFLKFFFYCEAPQENWYLAAPAHPYSPTFVSGCLTQIYYVYNPRDQIGLGPYHGVYASGTYLVRCRECDLPQLSFQLNSTTFSVEFTNSGAICCIYW
jgi:hypothetical protein